MVTQPEPSALPTGAVTFLFTDLEGSTQLLGQDARRYRDAVRRHHDLLRAAVEAHGGVVFETVGDAVYAAFAAPVASVAAALAGQLALHGEDWGTAGPLRARMGLHTGEVERRGAHYFGAPLYRCGRLMGAAHGGQVVLSAVTAALVDGALPEDASLRDLGAHRLRDLPRPERVFQLVHPALPADFRPLATLDARPHNLPVELTPFIGREREIAALREHLLRPEVRLLTLIGPGGVGKTRLALYVAAALLNDFEDGVFCVPLAAVSDPTAIASTIEQALGMPRAGQQPMTAGLQAYLRHKQLLLILDNFEQVLGAAPQVAEWLGAIPGLKVLVTSHAPLHVRPEHEFPVAPLAVPDLARLPPAEALADYAAVALFVERALAVDPHFRLTEGNARAIAELCYRLAGLPLAIELAAARVKLLPPSVLVARLDRGLDILTGGAQDAPPRLRTLRNTLDWSYNLLREKGEKTLFARLSIFVGGCTLDAVEAVCTIDRGAPAGADDPGARRMDMLDALASLVDKSLLQRDDRREGEARFRLLETIRDYALERLQASGEAEDLRRRHAEYYVSLAEAAARDLAGPEQAAWLERLELAHDNLRAALHWALDNGAAATTGRLAAALWRTERVRSLHLAILSLVQKLERRQDVAPLIENRAELERRLGEDARAAVLSEEGPVGQREGETEGIATLVLREADRATEGGDGRRALLLYQESLRLCHEVGERLGVAFCLEGIAGLLGTQRQPERAVRLLAAAENVRGAIGAPLRPPHFARRERTLSEINAQLGAQGATAGWKEGRETPLDDAVHDALTVRAQDEPAPPPKPPQPGPRGRGHPLTKRQQEVAALIARGMKNREIATHLVISNRTAINHVEHILTRLGFRSRAQVAAWAAAEGLVPPDEVGGNGARPGSNGDRGAPG